MFRSVREYMQTCAYILNSINYFIFKIQLQKFLQIVEPKLIDLMVYMGSFHEKSSFVI